MLLTQAKMNLNDDTVIVSGDFSENYFSAIQHSAQGFHGDNSQATLHPFLAYYNIDGEMKAHSFCFVSEYFET